MSFVESEYDRIETAAERFDADPVLGEPLAIWAVSHLVRGTLEVVDRQVRRADKWGQESLATLFSFGFETFANPDCRSVVNNEIVGALAGRLAAINADGETAGRGAHWGTFTWGHEPTMVGTIAGIGNAGTLRPPLYDAVRFDQPGQLTGRIEGRYEHPVLGPCLLLASYVIDLAEPAEPAQTDATGVLEGAVVTAGLAP